MPSHAAAPETPRDLCSELRAAHAELPDRHREALILREVEACSCAEVGAVLGLDPGAAAESLWRARLALAGVPLREIAPACERALTRLELLADGALDGSEAALLGAHLTGCAGCRARRATMFELGALYAVAFGP